MMFCGVFVCYVLMFSSVVCVILVSVLCVKNVWCDVMIMFGNVSRCVSMLFCSGRLE